MIRKKHIDEDSNQLKNRQRLWTGNSQKNIFKQSITYVEMYNLTTNSIQYFKLNCIVLNIIEIKGATLWSIHVMERCSTMNMMLWQHI